MHRKVNCGPKANWRLLEHQRIASTLPLDSPSVISISFSLSLSSFLSSLPIDPFYLAKDEPFHESLNPSESAPYPWQPLSRGAPATVDAHHLPWCTHVRPFVSVRSLKRTLSQQHRSDAVGDSNSDSSSATPVAVTATAA